MLSKVSAPFVPTSSCLLISSQKRNKYLSCKSEGNKSWKKSHIWLNLVQNGNFLNWDESIRQRFRVPARSWFGIALQLVTSATSTKLCSLKASPSSPLMCLRVGFSFLWWTINTVQSCHQWYFEPSGKTVLFSVWAVSQCFCFNQLNLQIMPKVPSWDDLSHYLRSSDSDSLPPRWRESGQTLPYVHALLIYHVDLQRCAIYLDQTSRCASESLQLLSQ